jgi:hypothetical protein
MLKGYTVTVVDELTGEPVMDKYLRNSQEVPVTAIVTSGQQIGDAFVNYYPYRDSSNLEDD